MTGERWNLQLLRDKAVIAINHGEGEAKVRQFLASTVLKSAPA
jgi:hypothetical protein